MQLLKFHASWCGPCKIMAPVAEKIAREFDLQLVPIDIDEVPELAQERGVRGIPTLIIVDDEGKELARHTGAQPQKKVELALGL